MTIEIINQKNELVGHYELPGQDYVDIIGVNGHPVQVFYTPDTNTPYFVIGDH